MDVAHAAIRAQDAVLDVEVGATCERGLLRLVQDGQVVGMHARRERLERAGELLRAGREDRVHLVRPDQPVGLDIQLPGTHARHLLRALQALLGLAQGLRLPLGLGGIAGHGEHQALARRPHQRPLHDDLAPVAGDVAVAEVQGRPACQHAGQGPVGVAAVVGMHQVGHRPPEQLVRRVAPDRGAGGTDLAEAAVGVDRADDVERVVHHQAVEHQRLFQAPGQLAQGVLGAATLGDVLHRTGGEQRLSLRVPHQRGDFAHGAGLAVRPQHLVLEVDVALAGVQAAMGLLHARPVVEGHPLEQRGQPARHALSRQAEDAQHVLRPVELAGRQVVLPGPQLGQALGAGRAVAGARQRQLGTLAVADVLEVDRQPVGVRENAHRVPAVEWREERLEHDRAPLFGRDPELPLDLGAADVGEGLPHHLARQLAGTALHHLLGARVHQHESPVAVERVEGIADAREHAPQLALGVGQGGTGALVARDLLPQRGAAALGQFGALAGHGRQPQRQRQQPAGGQAGEQQQVGEIAGARGRGNRPKLDPQGRIQQPDFARQPRGAGGLATAEHRGLRAPQHELVRGRTGGEDGREKPLVLDGGHHEANHFSVAFGPGDQQFAAIGGIPGGGFAGGAEELGQAGLQVHVPTEQVGGVVQPRVDLACDAVLVGPDQGRQAGVVPKIQLGIELEVGLARGFVRCPAHPRGQPRQGAGAGRHAFLQRAFHRVHLADQGRLVAGGLVHPDAVPDQERGQGRRQRDDQRQPDATPPASAAGAPRACCFDGVLDSHARSGFPQPIQPDCLAPIEAQFGGEHHGRNSRPGR